MDVNAVMAGFKAFLPTLSNAPINYTLPSGGPLTTAQVFDEAPPLPYAGDYPFVVIVAGDIVDNPQVEAGSIYATGTYQLLFCDLIAGVDENGNPMGDAAVTKHASLFASALSQGLAIYPAGRTLGGAVAWAGWGDGVQYQRQGLWMYDPQQLPVIAIPITVPVMERAISG